MKIVKENIVRAVHYAQKNPTENLIQIAKSFATDKNTVSKHLHIDFDTWLFDKQKHCYVQLEPYEQQIVEGFRKGTFTCAYQAAKEYSISSEKVNRICKSAGIVLQPANIKYHLNRNALASIETEEDAYILGFITADGYLSESRNTLFIRLHEKDEDILRKISQHFEYDGEIKYTTHDITKNKLCHVLFCSSQLIKNLNQYGLHHNKSLRETFYTSIPNHLTRHYVRGLIDGDGFVQQTGKGIGLCGSKDIITKVAQHLIEQLNLDLDVDRKVRQEKDSNLYRLAFSGQNAVKIMKYLYEDSRIYLNRKYELAKRYF